MTHRPESFGSFGIEESSLEEKITAIEQELACLYEMFYDFIDGNSDPDRYPRLNQISKEIADKHAEKIKLKLLRRQKLRQT
jgi:hypothetical protein